MRTEFERSAFAASAMQAILNKILELDRRGLSSTKFLSVADRRAVAAMSFQMADTMLESIGHGEFSREERFKGALEAIAGIAGSDPECGQCRACAAIQEVLNILRKDSLLEE